MYTTELTIAIPPTSWFYLLYLHSQNESDPNPHSSVEINCPLDSGPSISVPDFRIDMMKSQLFLVCEQYQTKVIHRKR